VDQPIANCNIQEKVDIVIAKIAKKFNGGNPELDVLTECVKVKMMYM